MSFVTVYYVHVPLCLGVVLLSSTRRCRVQAPTDLWQRLTTLIIEISYWSDSVYCVLQKAPDHIRFDAMYSSVLWFNLACFAFFTKGQPQLAIDTFITEIIFASTFLILDGPLLKMSWLDISRTFRIVVATFSLLRSLIHRLRMRPREAANAETTPLLHRNSHSTEQRRVSTFWPPYFSEYRIMLPPFDHRKNWDVLAWFVVRIVCMCAIRALNPSVPLQFRVIIDKVTRKEPPWINVCFFLGFYNLDSRCGIPWIDDIASTETETFFHRYIVKSSFGHVLGLDMLFHSDKNTGELIGAIENGQSIIGLIDIFMFTVVPVILDFCVAMVVVWIRHGMEMSIVILTTASAYLWVTKITSTALQKKSQKYSEADVKLKGHINESFHMWKCVVENNGIPFQQKVFDDAMNTFITSWRDINTQIRNIYAFQDIVLTCGFGVGFFIAVLQAKGENNTAAISHFMIYWSSIKGPIKRLSSSYESFLSALVRAEYLLQLHKKQSSIRIHEPTRSLPSGPGVLKFHGVKFSYPDKKPVLNGIELLVQPGSFLGIVGRSGGGKSTLMGLLFRHLDPDAGSILIDDQNIKTMDPQIWRSVIGIVPQEGGLFNGSIAFNLKYPNLNATQAEIEDACKNAAIHDKIISMPDGYDSHVGELGNKLSGGERQRILIARVLLQKKKIIVLDEATSAMDTQTEGHIRESIRGLHGNVTVIAIAHRLQTIMEADNIAVMDDGLIVEQGGHEELMRENGVYARMWSESQQTEVASGLRKRM